MSTEPTNPVAMTVMDRVLDALLDAGQVDLATEFLHTLNRAEQILGKTTGPRGLVAQANKAEAWMQDSTAIVKDGVIQGYTFSRYVLVPVDGGYQIIDALTDQNAGLISDAPRWITSLADRMDSARDLLVTTKPWPEDGNHA